MRRLICALGILLITSPAQSQIIVSGGRSSIVVSGHAPEPVREVIPEPVLKIFEDVTPPPVLEKPEPVNVPTVVKSQSLPIVDVFYSNGRCRGCDLMEGDIQHGALSGFAIRRFRGGAPIYPFVQYQTPDGTKHQIRGWFPGWADQIRRHFAAGEVIRSQVEQPAEDSPPRFIKYGNRVYDMEKQYVRCGDSRCVMCNYLYGCYTRYQNWKRRQASAQPDLYSTPEMIDAMLDPLRLSQSDILADLGCGDARVLIAAARKYGCRGVGVEINAEVAETARKAVRDAGLSDQIVIVTGDAVQFNPSRWGVTAITTYMFEDVLKDLVPIISQVKVATSALHRVPGLPMTQHDRVWVYHRT